MIARIIYCGSLLLLQLCCQRPPPHGDDHEEGPEPVSVTHFTHKLELFMEYPPLVAERPARFLAHLSVLADGQPVRSGEFVLEARRGSSEPIIARLAAPKRDGLYTPELTFPDAGEFDARILVRGPQVSDEIPLGRLVVHADEAAMRASSAARPEPADPANAVPFLMEQQWKIGMLLHTADEHSLVERVQCAGEVVAPLERSAVVLAPVAGRLLSPSGEGLPRLGASVRAGQVLAVLEPTVPTLNETATYALELRTRAVEIQRGVDEARAHFQFAQREYDRLAGLQRARVSSQREMYEVERDLALAQAQFDAAVALKAKYDEVAEQLDIFREAARQPAIDGGSEDPLRIRLTAPISGQVVSASHVDGEQLEAHEELFRIVNFDRVWVSVRVSEFDLARLPATPNALVVASSYPDRRIDVRTSGGKLVHFGSVVDPASRTVILRFEIPNPEGSLRDGMFAEVFLETGATRRTVGIPEQAIVMENGAPIAFVLLGGELFQKRELVLGARDGTLVEVIRGVSRGERVVSRGANLVKLAALSGSAFGPGHVH